MMPVIFFPKMNIQGVYLQSHVDDFVPLMKFVDWSFYLKSGCSLSTVIIFNVISDES